MQSAYSPNPVLLRQLDPFPLSMLDTGGHQENYLCRRTKLARVLQLRVPVRDERQYVAIEQRSELFWGTGVTHAQFRMKVSRYALVLIVSRTSDGAEQLSGFY